MTVSNPSASLQDSGSNAFDYPSGSDSANAQGATGASATVDRIAGSAHQTIDRLASAASSAASQLSEKSEDLMAAKEQWLQACSAYVKDNPLTALGIAAVAGFLLSRLMR